MSQEYFFTVLSTVLCQLICQKYLWPGWAAYSRKRANKHVGTWTLNCHWQFATMTHSARAYWPEPLIFTWRVSKLVFRAATLNQATFRMVAFSNIGSLCLVPLCSVTLWPMFLSALWPLFLCAHLTFPFLFVWMWPGHGYYLINKDYTLVGANEYFLIHGHQSGSQETKNWQSSREM